MSCSTLSNLTFSSKLALGRKRWRAQPFPAQCLGVCLSIAGDDGGLTPLGTNPA